MIHADDEDSLRYVMGNLQMKNKLIKWLGGITKKEHDDAMLNFKDKCCDFASQAIKSRAKYVGNDQIIQLEKVDFDVVLVGKRSVAKDLFLKSGNKVTVAPWVYLCHVESIITGI